VLLRPFLCSATALALAACNPPSAAEKALHPSLAGAWRLASDKDGCGKQTLRFDRQRLVQSDRKRELYVLDVRSAEVQGSSIEIEFAPSAMMMLAAKSREKVDELSNTTLTITLMVSGDSITLRDVQMRDPKNGVQAPTGSKRARMAKMFDLRRCPANAAS
jgi:hypothetical protein